MTIGFLFWLLMILWLVLGIVPWPAAAPPEGRWRPLGSTVLLFILLLLLGIQAFGWPIRS